MQPNLFRLMAILMLFGLPCFSGGPVDAAPEKTSGGENLGDDLLGDWALPAPVSPRQVGPTGPVPGVDQARQQLAPATPKAPAGEDIGEQGTSPLERISNRMHEAHRLIASQNNDGSTKKVQEAIVSDLDQLIDELSKQCKNCSNGQCDKPPQEQQQTSNSTPKPSQGKQPASTSQAQTAAQQSQPPAGGGKPSSPGEASDEELVKRLWGQLPSHMREQLLQSSADEFLPKYQSELEEYFRKLSEDAGSEPAAR